MQIALVLEFSNSFIGVKVSNCTNSTYSNFNVLDLITSIHTQAKKKNIIFEILCIEDGSKHTFYN